MLLAMATTTRSCKVLRGALVLLVWSGSVTACGSDPATEDDDEEAGSLAGRNCETDSDCGPDGHCLGKPKGICTVPASGPCEDGSALECAGGSRCWKTVGDEYYCWADCDARCGSNGECDDFGSCSPREEKGTHCSCSCSCSSCSASGTVTCSQPSAQCSSCPVVCSDLCAREPGCGAYLGASGSCT
jgi:hypothetical protein